MLLNGAAVEAPRFEVDPLWPKPLPNHWILGQTIGVSVDAKDNVWIIHRSGSLEARKTGSVQFSALAVSVRGSELAPFVKHGRDYFGAMARSSVSRMNRV